MKPYVMLIGVVLAKKISKGLVRVSVRRCEDELKRRMKTTFWPLESYNVSGSLDEPKVKRDDLRQSPRSSDCLARQDKNKPLQDLPLVHPSHSRGQMAATLPRQHADLRHPDRRSRRSNRRPGD